MNDDNPSDIDRFDAKLKAARGRIEEDGGKPVDKSKPYDRSMGLGMRMTAQLVAGALFGFGVGWAVDRVFGTKPWFMLAMLGIGVVAGIFSVIRSGREYERRQTGA